MSKNQTTDKLAFASRLVSARKAVGLSQIELARKVGVSQASLSEWENGESDMKAVYIRPLAQALGLTIEDVTPGYSITADEIDSASKVGLALIQKTTKLISEGRLSPANAMLVMNLLDALAS